ncbi:MAG: glycoside hydrolase family 88 protein, partial [Sphaerochaetaceae bacterium]|nr:glycoside hydrolase family 88 protein [Sphaerochaetaceae bacterium]
MIDSRKTMTERMALSAMKKYNFDNTPYSYKSAILLEGMFKASQILSNKDILDFVLSFMDYYVSEDGKVEKFKKEDYCMDHVRMGNNFLTLYRFTGNKKYKIIVDAFRHMLESQPRTKSGGFWHKGGYPNQMWLDGLYMQGPFYASYELEFGDLKACLEDIVPQFELIYEKTLDKNTGLLRHAWDESIAMPWCEKDTGRSQEVWARALGWYVMALADLLEIIPKESKYQNYRERLLKIATTLAPVVLKFQDKETGMWWQVMDKPNVGKNYLETSASCMFIYFFAKMNRLGFFSQEYRDNAQWAFEGLIKHSVTVNEEGELFLHDTCASAGLGKAPEGTVYRPADFKYYTEGEQRVTDNTHGISPFIFAALELEFPGQLNKEKHILSSDEDINEVLQANAGKAIVVIPKGNYNVGPVTIPSHTHLIFEEGAVLDFTDDFDAYPPVLTRWEGVNCYAMKPCVFINNAQDVVLEGPGKLNGNGQKWWDHIMLWKNGGRPAKQNLPCEIKLASLNPDYLEVPEGGGGRPSQFLRPPLLQILNCENIKIDGLFLTMSPFWTLHPVCVNNLILKGIKIENPYDSPNTDGIDIESCTNVHVFQCDVNVGDDGIAVKCGSGKEMMKFQRAENIIMEDCVVRNAHGGFVIGSETASGVKGAIVQNCQFLGTDRGIRIKTRRGRGGRMEDIHCSNIFMDNVICPISINMFYHCGSNDPQLYTLETLPVKEDTPYIGNVTIDNIKAVNCRHSAVFLAGLPEVNLKDITISNSEFYVKDEFEEGLEAEMCSGLPDTGYRGIRVINAEATIENITTNIYPPFIIENP